MWHRLVQALIAQPADHLDQTDRFSQSPVTGRPWDNGINYDIPTFLRRRMVRPANGRAIPASASSTHGMASP